MNVPSGYASSEYAHTCAHLGRVRVLPRSGVSVLVRDIDVPFAASDACGPYPLLRTMHWDALADDLTDTHDLLSFVAVVDPFSTPASRVLEQVFPDHRVAFKAHAIAKLDAHAPLAHVHADHRRKARRAARLLELEVASDATQHADAWVRLYAALRARHGFTGAADLTAAALAAQLALPGMLAVVARAGDAVVSMSLWLIDGATAHYHLGASEPRGYAAHASYGTFARAFEVLAERGVEWVDLGGAAGDGDLRAGRDAGHDDGLARFKRGWATGERTAWLGGRILDRERYALLAKHHDDARYFPAYRAKVAA